MENYALSKSKFVSSERLLKEILTALNSLPNKKVESVWFKNTYEIATEIGRFLNNKTK